MTTNPPRLQINQAKLFEAVDHNSRQMALVLALIELITAERAQVNFAHPQINRDVDYYRSLFRDSFAIAEPQQ